MAVTTETKPATMTEEEGRKNISPEAKVKTAAEAEVSPEEEARIYTQKQVDGLLHTAQSEWGRQTKEIEKERDTLKAEIATKTNGLTDIQAERDNLQTQLEDLTADDPKRFDLVKRDKDLREEQRKVKSERDSLENDKKAHQEAIKMATDTLLEIRVWEIAAEYDGGDAVRLKALCDTFGANSEEQIRKVAETLWTKQTKAEEEEQPPKAPMPYSGKSEGGAIKGRKPTLDEVKNATPEEFEAKVNSGEWNPFQ